MGLYKMSEYRKTNGLGKTYETILDTTQAAGEMIKKQKIVDKLDPTYGKLEFEKYMGFSSAYNSSFNPYYRKLLGVVPYLGIPLNNFATGYKQLASHLQVTGYTIEEASQQLRKFRNLDILSRQYSIYIHVGCRRHSS